jgi:hypothetical protein
MTYTPYRHYKLSLPGGPSFEAAMVIQGGGLVVLSNRSGKWEPDSFLTVADLIMPEQDLADWDITPLKPRPLD